MMIPPHRFATVLYDTNQFFHSFLNKYPGLLCVSPRFRRFSPGPHGFCLTDLNLVATGRRWLWNSLSEFSSVLTSISSLRPCLIFHLWLEYSPKIPLFPGDGLSPYV